MRDKSGKQRRPDFKRLLADKSIILVSNRGPIEVRKNDSGELETRRGGGGLVTAMTAISETAEATWISAAMTDIERSIAKRHAAISSPNNSPLCQVRLVDIPEIIYNRYYNTISNPLLWFIHHYIWNLASEPSITADMHEAWHEGYVTANKLFAEAVADEARQHNSPVVMLQDYHLFLAAQYIKELYDKLFLFHFTHIPWPEPNYMCILPSEIRTQLLEGMLSNDLLGFQSSQYAGNFLLCCETLLGGLVDWNKRTVNWQGRDIFVRTYPVSVDHSSLSEMGNSPDVIKYESKFLEDNQGLSLIVRTDRSDPSKNIIRGFKAFELLLSKHPELKGKVKFLALLYPTRENIKAYSEYRSEIESTVKDLNEKLGTNEWQPVYLRIEDNYPESIAALKCYDVLLVNPIYDGMNLVAKEGPVLNTRNGVLVLSENAGAFSELSNASLSINPFDIEKTADRIYEAIVMPEQERHDLASSLKETVKRNDSIKWLYNQLKDIIDIERKRSS